MKHLIYKTAVAIVATMAVSSFASAGNAPLGASNTPPARVNSPTATNILPAYIYVNATHATGGCALRNLAGCGFTVSGGPAGLSGYNPPTQAAYLYWAVLLPPTEIPAGIAAPSTSTVQFFAIEPEILRPIPVTGVLVTTAGDPCWGSGGTAIYRGSLPLGQLHPGGTGTYTVRTSTPAGGRTSGGDPWNVPVSFPAWEGVSMVLVGTGSNSVSLYDNGLPGEFTGSTNYTLAVASNTTSFSRFDNINADGQIGSSMTPQPGIAGENLVLNGVEISGSNRFTPHTTAPNPNSDYDGGTGAPLPRLWDNEAHDITGVPVIDPMTSLVDLNVAVNGAMAEPFDCLVTVANVVASSAPTSLKAARH